MTEWTVVGVLIALCGLVATIAKPMLNLNSAITRLTAKLDSVSAELQELNDRNRQSHDKLWNKLTAVEAVVEEHGRALAVIRHRQGGAGIQIS